MVPGRGRDDSSAWRRHGDEVRWSITLAPLWREVARDYAQYRLRQLRARPFGFVHPTDVSLGDGELVLRFPAGSLDERREPCDSFPRWRDEVLRPLLDALVSCHEQGVVGLSALGVVGGRWVPPVGWFLPPPPGEPAAGRADLDAARTWLEAHASAGRSQAPVRSFLDALARGDVRRLRGLLQAPAATAESGAPPSFLSLLTEGELLEHLRTVFRYRLLRADEVHAMGMNPRAQLVLGVDPHHRDPHFPDLVRPSPQEVWDTLVDDSRVTPLLLSSSGIPDPLNHRGFTADDGVLHWIGVHEDQPYLYLRPESKPPPSRGFVRLHSPGNNALMKRKRAAARFAGRHPALVPLLASPPPARPFVNNPRPRTELEEAILATRGVFAVQGPPGTGKTHLATEVVRRFLGRAPGGRVLVCAKEHFALDHILGKITHALRRDGVELRAWRSVSLARRRRARGELESEWLGPEVSRELASRGWAPGADGWMPWQAKTSDQHDQRLATLGAQAANIFFATTMDAAMVELLGVESFDLVIVEEAGKCYPSEILHALCLGRCVLMIGDQRQLPPYQERRTREGVEAWQNTLARALDDPPQRDEVAARFGPMFLELVELAKERGRLGETELAWLRPFELLFERLPARHRLEEQFRMEAPLSRVIGSVFYGRPFVHRKLELVDRGALPGRPLDGVLPPELDVPLLWIDTPHMTEDPNATEDAAKRGARDSQFEHDVVLGYLRRLRPGRPIDLVILTPYNAQKRLLLDSAPLREVCGSLTGSPFDSIVRTTDEYQGREAELTVLSLVRNNSLGARAWGFMSEPERLNVMFSRARHRQVVVGSGAHIERHAGECPWLHRVWQAYQVEARDPRCGRIMKAQELGRG